MFMALLLVLVDPQLLLLLHDMQKKTQVQHELIMVDCTAVEQE